jgi:hypothetical protein
LKRLGKLTNGDVRGISDDAIEPLAASTSPTEKIYSARRLGQPIGFTSSLIQVYGGDPSSVDARAS